MFVSMEGLFRKCSCRQATSGAHGSPPPPGSGMNPAAWGRWSVFPCAASIFLADPLTPKFFAKNPAQVATSLTI